MGIMSESERNYQASLQNTGQKSIIWCLFGVENNYDQPLFNLVAWWPLKPQIETLTEVITGRDLASIPDEHKVAIVQIYSGSESRIENIDYRLEAHGPGILEDTRK